MQYFTMKYLILPLCLMVLVSGSGRAQTLFSNVTDAAGVTHENETDGSSEINMWGTGAAWFDYDRDGDLDLIVPQRVGANRFFKNNGDGTFTDIAVSLGIDYPDIEGGPVAIADYNNDGWLDVYLANTREDILLKNINGTSFVDVTSAAGFDPNWDAYATTASWGDYDKDGYVDLYVSHHRHGTGPNGDDQDRLFHNNGDETFTDVSNLLDPDFSDLEGWGFIGGWTDFDKDGDLDIFLINDCPFGPEGTKLFRNDGGTDPLTWSFTEVGALVGADTCQAGMGLATGDFNRDGWMDYFYTNIGRSLLLKNNQGIFQDVTNAAGVGYAKISVNQTAVTWGCNFLDYDLDSWLDLFVVAGTMQTTIDESMPNALFHNDGNGVTFTDVSDGSGVNNDLRGRSSVFGDYDNDGDPDLYLVNINDACFLYRNDNSNGNNWLIVELEGTTSNRDGIGSKLRVKTPDGVNQYWETRSGSSLGGGDDLAAYFGLGSNSVVDTLEITWLSGIVQKVTNVTVNQRLKVLESGEIAPAAPNDLTASLNGSQIDLDWADMFGANSYNVYRDVEPYFSISGDTPLASPTASTYSDVDNEGSNNVIGDPDNNYFYVVTSVGGPESGASNRVGEFDFSLQAGFNFITLPLSTAGVADAEEMGVSIDDQVGGGGATAIYRLESGSWELMAFKSGSTWIVTVGDAMEVGRPYLVNMADSGTWTLAGGLEADGTNNLIAGFNAIMLKFKKASDEGIVDAEDLGISLDAGAAADGATAIYRLNNGSWELMAFKSTGTWIVTVSDALIPGYPYLVNLSEGLDW